MKKRIGLIRFASLMVVFIFMLFLSGCDKVLNIVADEVISYLDEEISSNLDNGEESIAPVEDQIISESVHVDGSLEVHFIDVGQADCILLKSNDEFMLIDAGNNDDAKLIKDYLKSQGVTKFKYVIGTHPHEDHIGSLDVVINNFEIETLIMPDKYSTSGSFEDVLKAIKNNDLLITKAKVGDKYTFGECEFVVLAPVKDYGDELNNASVVIRLTHGENSFMFTGDAEEDSEEDILKLGYVLESDVLKFGHHGSRWSTTDEFFEAVSPKYGVLMYEEGNSYGHPHKETIDRINASDIIVYETEKDGTIVAYSDGKNLTWTTNAEGSSSQVVTDVKEVKYILNTSSKKFHYSTCSGAESITKENKEEFVGTREELIKKGYKACGICKP